MSQVTAGRVKEERPFRNVRFGPTDAVVKRKPDGTVYIRSACALGEYPPTITNKLDYWAEEVPDRVLFAERDANGAWQKLTYKQAFDRARALGQALLDAKLSSDRPLVVLSGNDHGDLLSVSVRGHDFVAQKYSQIRVSRPEAATAANATRNAVSRSLSMMPRT